MDQCIKSGLAEFDMAAGGYQPGQFIVIAGANGAGKTYFITSLITGLAVGNSVPVGMFSLEMTNIQISRAIMCNFLDLNTNGENVGNTTPTVEMIERLQHAPIYIDDTSAISLETIKEKIIELKSTHDVRIIFIDYIQLIKEYRDSSHSIIHEIKHIAEETQVTIIASSKFMTSSGKLFSFDIDPDDITLLKDLMQSADTIAILNRPGFYSPIIAATLPKLSIMRIIKNPDDTPESIDFHYDFQTCKFTDYQKNDRLPIDKLFI